MSWWTLEPRDPVLFRDGRPFGPDADGALSLDFPLASTLAGTLRTRVGFAVGGGERFALTPEQAKAISVVGPLLAELGARPRVLLPAPRDHVLFGSGPTWRRHRLAPSAPWPTGASSLPDGLSPVEPRGALPAEKPASDPPAFWDGDQLSGWLAAPPDEDELRDGAVDALPHERRMHVAIDPELGTGVDGRLFSSDGLRLTRRAAGEWHEAPGGWTRSADRFDRFAFLAQCESAELVPGLVTWGGERRLSALERAPSELAEWLAAWRPPALADRRARVVLLTPALFAAGAAPARIGRATVRAAAVGRAVVVSGWDMAYRTANGGYGGPKAVRRCAPAGSVYWVEIDRDADPAEWAAGVHLRSVCDDAQDGRDGFGLAAVGVWA